MNLLLLADIGSNKSGYYHVGDEAMFYETYRWWWYRKHRADYNIHILSRSKSHNNLNLVEKVLSSDQFGKQESVTFYLKILLKIILYKFFNINKLNTSHIDLIKFLSVQNKVHFVGGGNFTSLIKSQLYFNCFIILICFLLRKEVILTSQSIGPFYGRDYLIIPFILNLPKLIAIREKNIRQKSLLKFLIILPNIKSIVDSAYTLPTNSSLILKKRDENVIRIGVSIHNWTNDSALFKRKINNLLNQLDDYHNIELIIIPHVFSKSNLTYDVNFFNKIFVNTSKKIKIINFNYKNLTSSAHNPSITIKYLTSQVDILISSRYHGLIFALSASIPCITFKMDRYYNMKNINALRYHYDDSNIQKYYIDLYDKKDNLFPKVKSILDNLSEEKKHLKLSNAKVNKLISIQRENLFF